jgi:hypothetical protein
MMLSLVALIGLGACGKPKSTTVAVGDSVPSTLPPPPAPAAAPLGDTARSATPPDTVYVPQAVPVPVELHRRRPPPPRHDQPIPITVQQAPAPAPAPAAEPEPLPQGDAQRPGALVLPRGTAIGATTIDSIHSRFNQPGDVVHVRVEHDIVANGETVIPAGSVMSLEITDIARAPERGEKGTLELRARSVEIRGERYPIAAHATDYQYEMKARGVGTSEVAKTGAGAAIGAIVGHIIGGKTGTVVGAVGGGAAGAAVAAKTADRDIIVHAGSEMTLVLGQDFSRS